MDLADGQAAAELLGRSWLAAARRLVAASGRPEALLPGFAVLAAGLVGHPQRLEAVAAQGVEVAGRALTLGWADPRDVPVVVLAVRSWRPAGRPALLDLLVRMAALPAAAGGDDEVAREVLAGPVHRPREERAGLLVGALALSPSPGLRAGLLDAAAGLVGTHPELVRALAACPDAGEGRLVAAESAARGLLAGDADPSRRRHVLDLASRAALTLVASGESERLRVAADGSFGAEVPVARVVADPVAVVRAARTGQPGVLETLLAQAAGMPGWSWPELRAVSTAVASSAVADAGLVLDAVVHGRLPVYGRPWQLRDDELETPAGQALVSFSLADPYRSAGGWAVRAASGETLAELARAATTVSPLVDAVAEHAPHRLEDLPVSVLEHLPRLADPPVPGMHPGRLAPGELGAAGMVRLLEGRWGAGSVEAVWGLAPAGGMTLGQAARVEARLAGRGPVARR